MTRKGNFKAEFDRKYNALMNSPELIDSANDVILKGIEQLDAISKYSQETILCSQHRQLLAQIKGGKNEKKN